MVRASPPSLARTHTHSRRSATLASPFLAQTNNRDELGQEALGKAGCRFTPPPAPLREGLTLPVDRLPYRSTHDAPIGQAVVSAPQAPAPSASRPDVAP